MKTNLLLYIFLSLFITSCSSLYKKVDNGDSDRGLTPMVKNIKELQSNWDKQVTLIGIYEEMLLPENNNQNSPLIKSERVKIAFDDYDIALETHEKGIRTEAERKQYLNKKVIVCGTLKKSAKLWGTKQEQVIVMDAIIDIKSIGLYGDD